MNSVPRQTGEFGTDGPPGERAFGSRADEVGAINTRLGEIARQIEYLSRTTATKPVDDDTRERLSHAIARIDARLDELARGVRLSGQERSQPSVDDAFARSGAERLQGAYLSGREATEIDRAAAEIAARQRALDGDLPPSYAPPSPNSLDYYAPRREAPMRYEAQRPTSPQFDSPRPAARPLDFSALENQIRDLTGRLETLNRPCRAEDMLEPLRKELADIGQKISEAMPRRAIEALEGEVRALAARLDVTRQTGVDAGALSGIERGLLDVREALLRMTPAESLVGFDHAVKTLTEKVDMLAASRQDPAAMEQLENSIAALRGIVGNVASSESLATLATEVRGLADKFDRGMRDPLLARLEQRMSLISEAVDAVRAGGQGAVPAGLDRMMATLNDKIEALAAHPAARADMSSGDKVAIDRLEDRIAQLVEKLDSSEARLGHLGAIERGMAELLVHLEDLRSHSGQGLRAGDRPPLDALSRDLEDLKLSQSEVKRLAQDSIETVQGSIDDVVGRLAMIEADMHGRAGKPAPAAPVASFVPVAAPQIALQKPADPPSAESRSSGPKPADPPSGAKPESAQRPPQQKRVPLDQSLPPDHPLEPGSGPPLVRVPSTPADRIAASEAPLRSAMAAPAEAPSKAKFLQAARDAAKTARNAKQSEVPETTAGRDGSGAESRLGKRMRMMFVGLSIIVLLATALRYVADYFEIADLPIPQMPRLAEPIPPPPAPVLAREAPPEPAIPPDLTAVPSVPAIVAPAPAPTPGRTANLPPTEITGAVPAKRAPAEPSIAPAVPAVPAIPAAKPPTDSRLPAGIGGKTLIAAADKGDPAAAYEVAMRYAEGRNVPRHPQEAVHWFERAAKAGLAPALFRLGTLYEKGNGVAKNLQEARRLYLAAADKGNAHAMHNIAVLYAEGIDGKPDYRSAAQWFRRAAQYGIADSQYNLAVLHARGVGVEQNLAESFKWFALAAKKGDTEAAKKRDEVAARLDKSVLATAQFSVDGWTAEREPDEATTVGAPPGGWDQAAAAPPRPKPRPRGKPAAPQ